MMKGIVKLFNIIHPTNAKQDGGLSRLYTFFIAVYLAEGLIGIAYEPIYFLQKDVLRLGPAQSALFTFVMTMPFLLKPLLGLFSDAVPLAGRRRVPYLLIASAATSAAWAALALLPGYSLAPTLFLLTLVNVGIAAADTLCDGVMVERGRSGLSGRFQSAQLCALYLALLVSGVGGGWLAQHAPYRSVFALTAIFPLFIFVTALGIREDPAPGAPTQMLRTRQSLLGLLRHPPFWTCAGLIFLYNFNPFLGTPMFYHQTTVLGFSKSTIGTLTSVSGICGALGAAAFGWLCGARQDGRPRCDAGLLLRWSIPAGILLALGHWAYRGAASAYILTALFGLGGAVFRLALMDLAARCSPRDAEASSFALFMAAFNCAAVASNGAGAWLYGRISSGAGPYAAMDALALIGALCTAGAWFFLRRLPLGAVK
jgi:MFS family permease